MSARSARLAIAEEHAHAAPFANAIQHIHAELEWLRLLLHREVLRMKAANLLVADPFRGLYLADEQVDVVLRHRNTDQAHPNDPQYSELHEAASSLRTRIDTQLEESELAGCPMPLTQLASKFRLSRFESHVVIAALAVEVDLRFEVLYSWVQNDVTRKAPSLDLVLRLFGESPEHSTEMRRAFSANSTLVANHLLRQDSDRQEREHSTLARPLRLDERICAFLLDQPEIDRRLAPFSLRIKPLRGITSILLPSEMTARLLRTTQIRDKAIWCFSGPEGTGKRSAVEALCAQEHRALLVVDLQKLIRSQLPIPTALSLILREAILSESTLLIEHSEAALDDSTVSEALQQIVPPVDVRIFITGEKLLPNSAQRKCPWHHFEFRIPSVTVRAQLWRNALEMSEAETAEDLDFELLSSRFALSGGAIERACTHAELSAELQSEYPMPLTAKQLETAARDQSNHSLLHFAQKIESTACWESLVAPSHILRQLRDVCTAERYRHRVYGDWQFDQRLTTGKGLNVLFCGSSGTGKTMAAGILARELGRDLYRVDLSIVVSKYIGETEKQLSLIFREAQTSNAMLFFDEADALFGKRSEVKDAHDRYANVEIAYLLQKMEDYEGIVILATNLRRNMDEAFSRRMHHVIEFPFPDAEHRERIWKRILPPAAPVSGDLDFGFLARQFEFTGGNIRNVALAAAFLAAEEGSAIKMEHCIIATAREMHKNGKLPSRSEFRDYYEVIRSRV